MTKTLALLLDSYRELNAKRLFWIVLVLSGLVVGAFAMIGIKNDTITILWWDTPIQSNILSYISPATLYKDLFAYFGIGYWLAWAGNVLALVSTAGIFPDFLAAGSIDLYLSKPIARLRLFLTKYLGGLLFVTLQVTIFSTCTFILLGTRGHSWEPKVFFAIPLVVLVFSYLFSFCVLIGVMTRSTVASILLTVLFWFVLWGVQATEGVLLFQSIRSDVEIASLDDQIAHTKAELADPIASTQRTVTTQPSNFPLSFLFPKPTHKRELQTRLDQLETERANSTSSIHTAHEIAYAALLPLPKTSGTTEILTRSLSSEENTEAANAMSQDREERRRRRMSANERQSVNKRFDQAQASRSPLWTIGTSLTFELVVVSLAAWLFCRRDY